MAFSSDKGDTGDKGGTEGEGGPKLVMFDGSAQTYRAGDERLIVTSFDSFAYDIGALMGEDELDGAPLEYRNTTCVKEIKSRCLGLEKASVDQRMNVIVGRALSLVPGWTRGARVETKEYGRQWVYKRDVPLLPSPGEGCVQATPAASAARPCQ